LENIVFSLRIVYHVFGHNSIFAQFCMVTHKSDNNHGRLLRRFKMAEILTRSQAVEPTVPHHSRLSSN